MPQMVEWSANEIATRVRSREVSRLEVVQAHLERIDAMNSDIGALVMVRQEEALREAAEADRVGTPTGLLAGVPVTVKAEYDVAGAPSSHGNRLLAEHVATQDSPAVARLRGQGAIVVGKGNQPDFAMRWNTHSSQIGWTRNPRDTSRSVGGSSGGDAAAVAAGMAPVGFGTDLAGSIRVPAAFCEIYGLRATPGRIPYASEDRSSVRTPAVEAMSSQGPLARSVEDLRLAFEATAGASVEHPYSIPARGWSGEDGRQTRVARIVDQSGTTVQPEMVAEVDRVCAELQHAGYTIEEIEFPGISRTPDVWGELLCTELRLLTLPKLRTLMDPSCYDHIDKLSQVWPTLSSTEEYLQRWEEWAQLRRGLLTWMQKYPLLVSPISSMHLPLALEYDHWASTDELTDLVMDMRNSLWPAALGMPAIALPNGVQIVGAPHRDEALFAPARVIESALPPCLPADVSG